MRFRRAAAFRWMSRQFKAVLLRDPRVVRALRALVDNLGLGAVSRRLYVRLLGPSIFSRRELGGLYYFQEASDLPPFAQQVYQDIKREIDACREPRG